jgi:predicted secreted protein
VVKQAPRKKPTKLVLDPEYAAEQEAKTEARQKRLVEKITKLLTLRDRAKKVYGQAGKVLAELVREMQPGETISLPDGRQATLTDAFARGNFAFRNTSFTRCDIEVTG